MSFLVLLSSRANVKRLMFNVIVSETLCIVLTVLLITALCHHALQSDMGNCMTA